MYQWGVVVSIHSYIIWRNESVFPLIFYSDFVSEQLQSERNLFKLHWDYFNWFQSRIIADACVSLSTQTQTRRNHATSYIKALYEV